MLKLKEFKLSSLFIINLITSFISFCCNSYLFFGIVLLLNVALDIFIVLKKYKLNAHQFSETDIKHLKRIALLFLALTISVMLVILRNSKEIFTSNLLLSILFVIISVVMLATTLFFAIKFKVFNFKFSKQKFLEYLPILIIMIFIILFSIDCFYTYPKYDSHDFYMALSKINIQNFNNVNSLKLCNHITVFYSIMVYVLYCLIGNLYSAAILFNIICNCFIALASYNMFKYILGNKSKIYPYICALIFAFSPFTLGYSGYIYMDTIMMYGVFFFVHCLITKQDADILFLSSLLAIFSKEVGFLITLILVVVPFFVDLFRVIFKKTSKHELKKYFSVYFLSMVALHVAFVVFFLIKNWAVEGGWAEYGFKIAHTLDVFDNILTINFNWIFSLFILIALIMIIVKLSKKQTTFKQIFANNKYLTPVLLTLLIALAFNTIVITWEHLRYLMIQISMLQILGCLALFYIIKNANVKNVLLSLVAVLCLAQAFITIDPLMLACKNKIFTGDSCCYVLKTGYKFDQPEEAHMDDNCCYNKQINMFDITFDKFLKEIEYNPTKCIITGSGTQINDFLYNSAWNSKTNRRYYTDNPEETIKYFKIDAETDLNEFNSYSEVYYINYNTGEKLPKDVDPNKNVNFYIDEYPNIDIEKNFDVEFFGWRFTISKLVIA